MKRNERNEGKEDWGLQFGRGSDSDNSGQLEPGMEGEVTCSHTLCPLNGIVHTQVH